MYNSNISDRTMDLYCFKYIWGAESLTCTTYRYVDRHIFALHCLKDTVSRYCHARYLKKYISDHTDRPVLLKSMSDIVFDHDYLKILYI